MFYQVTATLNVPPGIEEKEIIKVCEQTLKQGTTYYTPDGTPMVSSIQLNLCHHDETDPEPCKVIWEQSSNSG